MTAHIGLHQQSQELGRCSTGFKRAHRRPFVSGPREGLLIRSGFAGAWTEKSRFSDAKSQKHRFSDSLQLEIINKLCCIIVISCNLNI